ncbi:uncharacterized protein LOC143458259 [Clavelina lepadiformis]|uniref:DBF4-type domain-containing protein n=1 Tax=Clavelina lepadiformis TaxID=159417 RepID=A0ABP0FXX9_CLALP
MEKQHPLVGKRFFIDPKVEKHMKLKIKDGLTKLGGKVEEFLDGGIHFAVTSSSNLEKVSKYKGQKVAEQSPFNTSGTQKSINTNNRWKDLAKRAGAKQNSSTNVVDTARKLGIKLRSTSEVWHWLAKQLACTGPPDAGPSSRPIEIKLKEPCLKIEDEKSKPIYDEFETFSQLNLSVAGNKCPIVNESLPMYKKTTDKKKLAEKKGFCECCQRSYLNERKHRKDVQHINFGEVANHYEKLDKYITTNNLDLSSFLRRQVMFLPVEHEADREENINTKHRHDRICCQDFKPDMSSLTSTCEETKNRSEGKSLTTTESSTKHSKSLTRRTSPRKLASIKISLNAEPCNTSENKVLESSFKTTPHKQSQMPQITTILTSETAVSDKRVKKSSPKKFLRSMKTTNKPQITNKICDVDHYEQTISFETSPVTRSKLKSHHMYTDKTSATIKLEVSESVCTPKTKSPCHALTRVGKRKRSPMKAKTPHDKLNSSSEFASPVFSKSSRRKLDTSTEIPSEKYGFTRTSQATQSTDDLIMLLNSSTRDSLLGSEFLGFESA